MFLLFWSRSEDVCICACVTFPVHLGGISHRCMHSSRLETCSSRVIYYPNSLAITVVFVLNPPVQEPVSATERLLLSSGSWSSSFFIIYALLQVHLCQSLEAKTQKLVFEYPPWNNETSLPTVSAVFLYHLGPFLTWSIPENSNHWHMKVFTKNKIEKRNLFKNWQNIYWK